MYGKVQSLKREKKTPINNSRTCQNVRKPQLDGSGSWEFVSSGSKRNTRGLCEVEKAEPGLLLKMGNGVGFPACKGRLGGKPYSQLAAYKEYWVLKNWCFQIVVLEKPVEIPSDSKEIKLVNPKGNQPWIFIRWNAEDEAPILWAPDAKSWLIGKDPEADKDWGQEEKGATEDEMVGWMWIWGNSGRYRRTGKPGMLQSIGSQELDRS